MIKLRITFEEDDKFILEKEVTLKESNYDDGKRMLNPDIMWDLEEIINEVEDIVNGGEPKF